MLKGSMAWYQQAEKVEAALKCGIPANRGELELGDL